MRRRVVSNRVAALSVAILVALVALTISGVIAATVSATETRSLTSSADTQIVEHAPTKNYGAATSLGVNENDQSTIGKDKFALLKWDLSGIAPGTQINSASVTLSVTTASPQTYQAYVLKKSWAESAATWNVYSSGKPWEVAGAKGSLDKEATATGSITPSVKGKNTLTLPLAVVQGWVDNPATNQGIIIANPSSTRGFNFNSREDTDPTQRPQLTLDLSPDTDPPETTIDSSPANPSNNASPSFSFTGSDNVTPANSLNFECKLDGGTFAPCTSPKTHSSLADGSHTFQVRAKDAAGNVDQSPASYTWTVDTAAPNASIDSGPSGAVSGTSASFTFSSNDQGATLQCSLDGDAFTSCSSPKSYTGLSDGSHTFQVRSTDAADNTDPIPASTTWTVDAVAPDTTIDSGPSGTIGVAEATFAFSSEEGATFECRLDEIAYSACSSPKSYSNLSNGTHTFDVRARDAAGNVDASPASGTFSVEVPPPPDTTPPETTIDSGPRGTVSSSSADFAFSSSEPNSTFECSLDSAAYTACTSPKSYSGLSEGSHTLQAKATDEAGNTDASPASRIWTVDTTSPETTIDIGPADGATLSSGDVSFTFSSDEAGSTFECRLDGAAFASCTSPKDYTGHSESLHTFEVRATDGAGNVDPTPAVLHYSVELPAPDTDDDTLPDLLDNCPLDPNADQADLDNDGAGDACDSQDNRDSDGDGVQNYQDNCVDQAGPPDNEGCPLPPPACEGRRIAPGDDLDAIVNSDPATVATTFCVEPGTYTPDNTVRLNDGDRLIGAEAELVSRGPALYPASLPVLIRNGGNLSRITQATGRVEMKWLDIAGGVGVTGNTGSGQAIGAGQSASGSVFQYLRIHDNDVEGVGGPKGLLANSELYANGSPEWQGPYSAGMKTTTEMEARENYVHDNIGMGLWCDTGCANDPAQPNGWWIHHNLLVDNDGQGVRYEHAPHGLATGAISPQPTALIEHNAIHGNNWAGASTNDAQNVTYQLNTFGAATIAGVSYGQNTARNSTTPQAIQFTDSGRSDRTDLHNASAINNALGGESMLGCEKPDAVVYCSGNS